MKITQEMLQKKHACKDGIDLFNQIFPNGFNDEWTYEKQIEIVKSPLRKYFGWAIRKKIIPSFSLSDSDLSGSNLRYSNLRYSDLSGSNLRYSNLRYSNLSGSNLSGSNLSGSNLRYSDLSNAYRPENDLQKWGWIADANGLLKRM